MAIDIIVVRMPGDKQGQDIVDPILSNTNVAVLRGIAEIQDNEPVDVVTLSTNYRSGVRKGDIAEVIDELQGEVWRGKIVGISHNTALADIWTDLDIEKPRSA